MLTSLAVAAALAAPQPCVGPPPISLQAGATRLPVLESAEYLAEAGAPLGLREVAWSPGCDGFGPVPAEAVEGVAAGRGHWLRFGIAPSAQPPDIWLLVLRFPAFDSLCVHWPLAGGLYDTECAGLDRAMGERPVPHHRFVFPLPARLDPAGTVYLRAQSSVPPYLRAELTPMEVFLAQDHREQFVGGLFFGVLAASILFGLAVAVSIRDRVSLLYAGHLSCLTLAVLGFDGRGREWLWWWLGPWDVELTSALLGAAFVLGAAFGRGFLRTRSRLPPVDGVLRASAALAAAGVLTLLFDAALAQRLISLATLVFVVGLATGAFVLARRGDRPARFLLAGVSAFLVGTLVIALGDLGLPLSLPPGTGGAVARAGMLIGAVALTLGLGQRVRDLRRERDRAKAEADAQQAIALLWASTDELTQLPSRSRFVRDGTRVLGEALGSSEALVVCVVDVLRFREVHHGFGQEADAVLVQVARRLRRAFSRDTLLARLGSDDFAIATRVAGRPEESARELARRALSTFDEPFPVGERSVRLEATAGLAWAPDYGRSVAELLRTCDAAIYTARERGEGPVAVYASDESAADLALRAELWRALEKGELLNVYQPQHDLRNAERVGGVETLLRWRHPERGVLGPAQFLGVAEKSELISHIGEWTLRQACSDLKRWMAASVAPEKLAVNVSALDFQRPGFGESIGRLIEAEQVPAERIELELTESLVLADLGAARATIHSLRAQGVRVSLDDFGTGYSSLTQLRELPITGLKVDQSFVAALDRSPEANAILSTLVALAGELGLEITAEGVESAWQRDVLRRHGCHLAQGFYFARPMPAAEMTRYLGGARTGPVEQG